MSLNLVFEAQSRLQNVLGNHFDEMTEKERAAFIKENILWVIDELCEALHELPYAKTWSNKYDREGYDKEKQMDLFKEEIMDSFTFFLNLFLAIGMTPEEVIKLYFDKNKLNLERQKNPELGYI